MSDWDWDWRPILLCCFLYQIGSALGRFLWTLLFILI